jgi:protein-S-isoprenylcysteine O-methyltransferase Ste14
VQRSDGVVAAQLLAMAGLLWPGRGRWRLPGPVTAGAVAVTAAGAALGAAGLRAQGTRLTPRVEPPAGAGLLTEGPYRVSRHPVYAGLLIGAAGWAVLRRRPEPLLAWAALAAVLHVKTQLEEHSLRARFGSAYDDYASRTPRMLGRAGR